MTRPNDVLLVSERDDDVERLEDLLQRMSPRRFELRTARRTDRPVELLGLENFAAILLAHDQGTEYFLRLARRQESPTPLIVLLDDGEDGAEARLREMGAMDVLRRDQLREDLLQRILDYATLLKSSRSELKSLATRDTLSGALSRNGFRAHLDRAVARAERHHRAVGLLIVNIDKFTLINEQFGEETGDRLIRLTAQRLASRRRHTDSVARLNGDEFAVILEDIGNETNLERIANEMIQMLSQPILIGDRQIAMDVSVGSALYPQDARNHEGLVDAARRAMQQAKQDVGTRTLRYREQLAFDEAGNASLASELRQAVRTGQLGLHFQPRVEINSGEMVGMEALLRWHHPRQGLLLPKAFMGNCESMGLMTNIGYQVIQQVCDALKWMDRRLVSAADIAVNISFEQLLDERFVEVVTDIVRRSGIDPRRLEFELTESATLRDHVAVLERMTNLSTLGIKFSLDDFGTGFSQLSHIAELPISALKIDTQFVRDAPTNPQRRAVCRSIIELARGLDITVIAEGVENVEQLRFLADEGCHQVQGFFFSEGLPLDQIPLFVQELRQNKIALSLA